MLRKRESKVPGTVSALERGIAILRCFEAGASELSNAEIARRTGLPRPTVTRLVATLISVGYLRQLRETDRFALGPGVVSLAQAFLSNVDVRARARPFMVELAEAVGMTVYLGVRNGLDMVLIQTCRSRSTELFSRLDVGDRVSIAASSLGRSYLAGLDVHERVVLIEQLLLAGGNEWARLAPGIDRAIHDAADRGYCLSLGDRHPDIHSIGMPLATASGELMALSCAGPALAFPEERLRADVAPRLAEAVKAIARDIGGSLRLGSANVCG
ncbi:MAG: IclR family transcriptional regulator [Chloroflexota bacterium]|nr:IclR family transcriptional regulator [Chloroflexota bacterium]